VRYVIICNVLHLYIRVYTRTLFSHTRGTGVV